jgi:hypothetical protein
MYKVEKNGSRTEIARSDTLPSQPVQTDVHVPGGMWFLNVGTASAQVSSVYLLGYAVVQTLFRACVCHGWFCWLLTYNAPNVNVACCFGLILLCWGFAVLCCLS